LSSGLVRELLDAGVHFGHHASRWNPKMAPYIYGKRNGIHIIDIKETVRGLLRAKKFVTQTVANGSDILFVGTKRQAKGAVEKAAERCGMHRVTERWLGGMLTNARTIRLRLKRLRELEELVDSPKWESGYSKKMKSMLSRELRKIRRNLDGVREMQKLPGALVVVDVRKEHNAIREAQSLNIPTLCLLDTDSDPDAASIPIPGNDDAIRAINVVMETLADSVEEGKKIRVEKQAIAAREEGQGGRRRGRGRDGSSAQSGGVSESAPAEAAAEAPSA
jgi:small subunit ribosomal protein S2